MKKIAAVLLIFFLCFSVVSAETIQQGYRIEINAAARTMSLYNNGALVREYPVAVGKMATKSPIGSFKIINKVVNPYWNNKGSIVAPGPKNPLGIRWMGISAPKGTYGIHGNSTSASIGTFASGGCIRMYNSDVEQLYSIIGISTPVNIKYENVELKQDPFTQTSVLVVYPDVYKQRNARAVIKNIMAEDKSITEAQAEAAIKLSESALAGPAAVGEGIALFLNGRYATNAVLLEKDQVYLDARAAAALLGVDERLTGQQEIEVLPKEDRAYINLTQAAAKLGGSLSQHKGKSDIYLKLSVIEINGRYLDSYKGGFDKEYLTDAKIFEGLMEPYESKASTSLNLKTTSAVQGWQLKVDSLNKIMNIQIPLKIRIGSEYAATQSYMGKNYVSCNAVSSLPDIENQGLHLYNYQDQNYYDVDELMERYEFVQDAFLTIVEFPGSLKKLV